MRKSPLPPAGGFPLFQRGSETDLGLGFLVCFSGFTHGWNRRKVKPPEGETAIWRKWLKNIMLEYYPLKGLFLMPNWKNVNKNFTSVNNCCTFYTEKVKVLQAAGRPILSNIFIQGVFRFFGCLGHFALFRRTANRILWQVSRSACPIREPQRGQRGGWHPAAGVVQ